MTDVWNYKNVFVVMYSILFRLSSMKERSSEIKKLVFIGYDY